MWHPAFLFFFQALGVYNIMIRLRPRCRAYPFISIPSHSVSSRFIQAALLLKLCLHHSFDILLGKIWDWSTLDIPLHPTPFLVFAASPLCACALHLPKKKFANCQQSHRTIILHTLGPVTGYLKDLLSDLDLGRVHLITHDCALRYRKVAQIIC